MNIASFKRFRTNCRKRSQHGRMNKMEQEHAERLELRLRAGNILWYKWEGMKFKLANKTWYTPDFVLLQMDGQLVVHEVKGYWEDDARVKVKVFAEQFPFLRVKIFSKVAKKYGGGWKEEEI